VVNKDLNWLKTWKNSIKIWFFTTSRKRQSFAFHKEIRSIQIKNDADKVEKRPGHTRVFSRDPKNSHIQGPALLYLEKLVLTGLLTLLFITKPVLATLLFIAKPVLVFSAGKQWKTMFSAWLYREKHVLSAQHHW